MAAVASLGAEGEAEIANIQRAFKLFAKGNDKIETNEFAAVGFRIGWHIEAHGP